jgi:hypothetical protein
LVEDLTGELGEVRPIELQVVGTQLQTEKIMTLAQYRQQGSSPKEKLVGRYLAEVVKDCGSENESVAQLVLYLLTDENNTRPLKTRPDLEKDLKALAADLAEADKLDLVLEICVKSGLVVLLQEFPANRYQLVHDYLVSFIRQEQGSKLLAQLKEAQEQRRLSEEQRKLSEKKLNRFLKRALAGSVAAAFILGISIVSALRFARQAKINEVIALSKSSEALFASHQELEALIEAIRARKKLQQLGEADADTQLQVVKALQPLLYKIKEYNRLEGHRGGVKAVSISRDGQMIASASNDTTVKLWKKDGTLLKSLDDHKGEVNAVSISPDGQMIASASDDKTVKLWRRDGRSGKTLSGYRGAVKAISFSPDSQTLALATDDKTVILWNLDLDLDLDQLVVYACDWVRDYLKNNSKVEKNNRTLCDDIPSQK